MKLRLIWMLVVLVFEDHYLVPCFRWRLMVDGGGGPNFTWTYVLTYVVIWQNEVEKYFTVWTVDYICRKVYCAQCGIYRLFQTLDAAVDIVRSTLFVLTM